MGTTYSLQKYGLCPKGYYCPAGTSTPNACLAGYYLDADGSDDISDCLKCPAGYYCSSAGLGEPDGQCAANYYCPEGSTSN